MVYHGIIILETDIFEKIRSDEAIKNRLAIMRILGKAKVKQYKWNFGASENGIVRLAWRGEDYYILDCAKAFLDALRHFTYVGDHGYAFAYLSENGEDSFFESSGEEFADCLWLKTERKIVCELTEDYAIENTIPAGGGFSIDEMTNGRYIVRSRKGKMISNVDSLEKAREIVKEVVAKTAECERGKNEYVVLARVVSTVQKKIKADSLDDAYRKVEAGCVDYLDWGGDNEFLVRPDIVDVMADN